MKTLFKNRIIAIVLALLAAAPAFASNGNNPFLPIELKFIGHLQEQPLFQLSFNSTTGRDEFTITVRDQQGVQLYRETTKGETFNKKFLLNTEELGDATLLFEVFSKNAGKSVVYQLNHNTREVNETVIRELK